MTLTCKLGIDKVKMKQLPEIYAKRHLVQNLLFKHAGTHTSDQLLYLDH